MSTQDIFICSSKYMKAVTLFPTYCSSVNMSTAWTGCEKVHSLLPFITLDSSICCHLWYPIIYMRYEQIIKIYKVKVYRDHLNINN